MSGFIHTLNIGDFLAPVIQGILIHVIAYMIIEILKNRKQKDKKDGCSRPFCLTLDWVIHTLYTMIIYYLATKYKNFIHAIIRM